MMQSYYKRSDRVEGLLGLLPISILDPPFFVSRVWIMQCVWGLDLLL